MHILISLLFAGILSLSFVGQTQAASGTSCVAMYGGGYSSTTSCAKITIDKKVLKPGTKEYVDSISGNDPKYQAGQEVTFEIVVKNVGSNKLEKIVVTDTLPQYVTFVSGPGSYDKDTNKLSFVIASLDSGASETIYITTKVVDTVVFPEKGFTCVTNYVHASVKDVANADDSAQFCIESSVKVEKPVLGVKKTPSTGPADAALPLLAGIAGAGVYLTRKTRFMIIKKRGGVTK